MNEQEARNLADRLQHAEALNNFIVKGVMDMGDGTWAVQVWAEVEGNILITQSEPKESVEMQREHVEAVLSAYDSLSTKLSLQQFYNIVQVVWKQRPDVSPNAIATYIDVTAEELSTTDPDAIIARITQFLGSVAGEPRTHDFLSTDHPQYLLLLLIAEAKRYERMLQGKTHHGLPPKPQDVGDPTTLSANELKAQIEDWDAYLTALFHRVEKDRRAVLVERMNQWRIKHTPLAGDTFLLSSEGPESPSDDADHPF